MWATKNVKALCKTYFGDDITPSQETIIRAVAFDEHPRVVICCMTRYGKSWSVARGILLWIASHPNKRLAIVAPTADKTSIIRNYFANLVTECPFFLDLLDLERTGAARIRREVSHTRMTWKNGVETKTLSADGRGAALMGFGADKVIVDETCDIPYEVYRAKITRMLGDNPDTTYVEIGNPWHRDNQMWEHWTNPDWCHIHVGYKIALEDGRITRDFLEEQRATLTDREFQVLYSAEFPETSEDALINWEWIERSYKKERTTPEGAVRVFAGVDVAEQGNDLTVVTIGSIDNNGYWRILGLESWGKTDLMPTVGRLVPILERYNVDVVRVDANGIGSGVYGRLSEMRTEGRVSSKVVPFKGGISPSSNTSKERFMNANAESYWYLRGLFENGKIELPARRELVTQLSRMKWEFTSAQKIRIRRPGEKEGDTSEEKSPDFADSLNILCWGGGVPSMSIGTLSFNRNV